MFQALQVLTVLLVAASLSFALAHAAELPGKKRLDRETYLAVQPMYYPGFTIGGASEPLAIVALTALLFCTPAGTSTFWWTASALISQLGMHAVYWLMTHPVNNFWLRDTELTGPSSTFFAAGGSVTPDPEQRDSWTSLRDRWEHSHVVRAGLGAVALVLVVIAVTQTRQTNSRAASVTRRISRLHLPSQ